ncbi:hypothetical protein [Salipaludibacillus daqingensis]|uniref:hypothetical protein n=1 Tax=Salipaludibacillus daqingensis TaxID=3041001 RepID=UPI002473A94A|nr:hypothetical protein [Salipaludibacillus daqingensis]
MNRGKSYRILIVLLFFAFISLISRSIIYLVISLTIAVLIIVLLSRDVKDRERRKQINTISKSSAKNHTVNVSGGMTLNDSLTFPILFFISGLIMASFGFTGYFQVEGVFHQLGWMTDEVFVQLVFLIVGILLILYGFTVILKKWLS